VTLIRIFPALILIAALCAAAPRKTALDRYVAQPDSNFRYKLVKTIPGQGNTAYVLDMISQRWRSEQEVDRPLWQHWVTIVKPDRVRGETGLLYITGGANDGRLPERSVPDLAGLAVATESVVVELRMVPNQPLTFAGETKPRFEDSLIAYTWDKYLRGGDDHWPARLPMTKSAVRAMDAAMAFLAGAEGGGVALKSYVVAGGSKRGWTTWTTAAVDPRVVAIAPLVIDMLNVVPSFEHHYRAYGFFAPAVKDYQEMRIMDWSGHPRYRELMEIEEPYSYRDRLTMPKFMINATGDEFFLPDSSQFYFDDLRGEKHVRYVPNTGHSLSGSDARESLAAFYLAILRQEPRPNYSWKFTGKDGIRLTTETKPAEVKLWQATNPKARDFRVGAIGRAWTATPLASSDGKTYSVSVEAPAEGFTAYFLEMTYPGSGKHPLKFTSGVRVTPDRLPYPAYQPKRPTQ
jgi:PhoPQ-activated pathogenicity-related protein